jgi:mannose-6-phosphate isomerase-like protein (cupin superfamily)
VLKMENPTAEELETRVVANEFFRDMFYTYAGGPPGTAFQLGAMCIEVRGVIPKEIHTENKQSFLVYAGECTITTWKNDEPREQLLSKGDWADIVPGTPHEVRNTGSEKLKLLTEYNPPHHPQGRIDKTFEAAEAREKAEEQQSSIVVCAARGCSATPRYLCKACRKVAYCCPLCQECDWHRHTHECTHKQ